MVFDDVIADMEANKSPIVTKLFLREKRINISVVFISQINKETFYISFQSI